MSGQLTQHSSAISIQKEDIDNTTSTGRVKTIRVERDLQQVTVEGFRTLGVVSIFIAGIESQCFSLTSDLPSEGEAVKAINGLLVIGLILSSFGAITALISARWFDLLGPDELELLECRVTRARAGYPGSVLCSPDKEAEANKHFKISEDIKEIVKECRNNWRNRILARTVFVPFLLTILGFCSFVISMIAYTWKFQPVATAVVATVASGVGFFAMLCMHLDYEAIGAIDKMRFQRLRI